jgi:hypothetical protein
MNLIQLGKVIFDNFFFMRVLTRHITEPIHLTEEACQKVFDDLKTNAIMSQKFALVLNIKTQTIDFQLNTDSFLSYKGQFDLKKFFDAVHPDFIIDYLRWGQAVYSYAIKNRDLLEPMNQSARITIPLKLSDGKYHWVLQEALPLQVDKDNNLVSHLNIYTILYELEEKEDVKLESRIYNKGFEMKEWTKVVWKEFFTRRPFDLPDELKRILFALHDNLSLDNKTLAEQLDNKSKHTIDRQNKQILIRAREAFPSQTFDNIKDLVRFLRDVDYFNGNKNIE